jgi:hypothetical protein
MEGGRGTPDGLPAHVQSGQAYLYFAKKLCDYRNNHYFAKKQILAIIATIAKRLSPLVGLL